MVIVSRQNEQVKQWARLLQAKGRTEAQAYVIEGFHLVEMAIVAGAPITDVWSLVGEGDRHDALQQQLGCNVHWHEVSSSVMQKITDTVTVPVIAARVTMNFLSWEQLCAQRSGHWLALDAVQDPGNVGTIIRTVDALGGAGLLCGLGSADVYHPKTVRATKGSLFHVPLWGGALVPALQSFKAQGIRIVGLAGEAENDLCASWRDQHVCWVLGNEGNGLSPEVRACCDDVVRIPMRGRAQSLNVGMVAGIVLYEMMSR